MVTGGGAGLMPTFLLFSPLDSCYTTKRLSSTQADSLVCIVDLFHTIPANNQPWVHQKDGLGERDTDWKSAHAVEIGNSWILRIRNMALVEREHRFWVNPFSWPYRTFTLWARRSPRMSMAGFSEE